MDVLGSFDDAVKLAADKAGVVGDYKLKYYPKQKSFIERLVNDYENDVRISTLKEQTGELYPWFRQWERVKTYQGIQTRMPFELVIQ